MWPEIFCLCFGSLALFSRCEIWSGPQPIIDMAIHVSHHLAPSIHIGILSHPYSHHRIRRLLSDGWIKEFMFSPFYGGIHVATDSFDNLGVPIAVLDWSEWKTPEDKRTMTYGQATKRLTSLIYYLEHTSAPFYMYLNDDSHVFLQNLHHLIEKLVAENLTEDSFFMLGNCMRGGARLFLQGAAGYLMSRKTATVVAKAAQDWLSDLPDHSEDWQFARLMDRIDLNMADCASEFQLGQYIGSDFYDMIENGHLEKLPNCSAVPWRRRSCCRPFLAQFNKLVVLHRLSMVKFSKPVVNVSEFPDDVMWWMQDEFPQFCRKL